jgi:hypothetical protein
MSDKPDREIKKLKLDLQSVSKQIEATLAREYADIDAIPKWAIAGLLEDGKSNALEAEEFKWKLEKHRRGPKQRAIHSQLHIECIIKIMNEIRTEFPNSSKATIRKTANKRYGKARLDSGDSNATVPFYLDDKYLQRKIKQYYAKS